MGMIYYLEALAAILLAWTLAGLAGVAIYNIIKYTVQRRSTK